VNVETATASVQYFHQLSPALASSAWGAVI
jgi:hypothetical protein